MIDPNAGCVRCPVLIERMNYWRDRAMRLDELVIDFLQVVRLRHKYSAGATEDYKAVELAEREVLAKANHFYESIEAPARVTGEQ